VNQPISWTLNEGVYELELCHDPCNEIGTKMLAALEEFVDAIDPSKAHAVIIYSTQRNGFCAGADLRELYHELIARRSNGNGNTVKRLWGRMHQLYDLREFLERIHDVFDRLDMLPITTIGAVHGVCFGGGFELALTCDLLIVDKTARFCFPELRLGIIPGFGGIPRLKRAVGTSLTQDLLLTGRSINAKKAVAVGLASQMVAPGEALNVARRVAEQVGRFDRNAASTAKAFIKQLPAEELAEEKRHFVRLFQSPVVLDALKRFVETDDIRPYLP
jgi:enoyl-CoA hydratase/carnithine racemase